MRDQIGTVLDGVVVEGVTPADGLDGREQEPPTLAPFQAWPVWVATAWSGPCTLAHEWHVVVILPAGDVSTWTPAADALLVPIRTALEAALGHITRVEPVTVAAGDASTPMPALRFYLTTPAASI